MTPDQRLTGGAEKPRWRRRSLKASQGRRVGSAETIPREMAEASGEIGRGEAGWRGKRKKGVSEGACYCHDI